MLKNVFKKYLVIGLILLFLGASVVPSIRGNIVKMNNSIWSKPKNILDRQPIYVDNDSDCATADGTIEHPFCNISDAIDYANDYDLIYVANGTYYENIIVKKEGLILVWYESDIIGNDTDGAIIDGGGVGNVIGTNKKNINIIGFIIRNSGPLNGAGIYVYNGPVEIRKNTIEHCHIGINFCYVNPGDGIEIEKNIIRNNDWGVYTLFSHNNQIQNNYIENNYVVGIALDASRFNFIYRNEIKNDNRGLWLSDSHNNKIRENNFRDNINSDGNIIHVFSRNSRNSYAQNYWNPHPNPFLEKLGFYLIWDFRYSYQIGRNIFILPRLAWGISRTPNNIDP